MLFFLSYYSHTFSFLNIFKYITLRSAGALFSAFFFVFFLGPWFIGCMRKYQKGGQPIRADGPERHLILKKNTPTMGGILLAAGFILGSFLWADLRNPYLWIVLGNFLALCILGGVDDFIKVKKQNSAGISGKKKFFWQSVIALISVAALWYYAPATNRSILFFPFFKNVFINLGWLYFLWGPFVIIGASNAVNLTDGLDGLAIGPVIISSIIFAILSYLCGHAFFSAYLKVPHVFLAGELSVLCSSLIGAGLGFLWYNSSPAMIFMGDAGSLALGGFLGLTSLMIKQEILFTIVGGVFVLETISVMVQVLVFKKTGKRFFLMAPIHHHFEKKGWSEPTVVLRFWIISCLLGLLALTSVKIR